MLEEQIVEALSDDENLRNQIRYKDERIAELENELNEGRKRWAYFESRFVKCIDRFSEEDKRKLGAMGAIIDTKHEVYIDLEKLLTIAIDNDDLK